MKNQEKKIEYKMPWWKDYSLLSLTLANSFVILIALNSQVPISSILFSYWVQSAIIGLFGYLQLCNLKNFSYPSKYEPLFKYNNWNKNQILNFFRNEYATRYVMENFIYLMFLLFYIFLMTRSKLDWGSLLFFSAIFFINHLFSFFYNFKRLTESGDLNKIFHVNDIRNLPMHFSLILLIVFGQSLLLPFMLTKMFLDMFGHAIKFK